MRGSYCRGAISSVGRASRLHREGRQFEPVIAHHAVTIPTGSQLQWDSELVFLPDISDAYVRSGMLVGLVGDRIGLRTKVTVRGSFSAG